MDNLKLRLEILRSSGQIDEQTEQKVLAFLAAIDDKLDVTLTEDNASMLAMHAAMALARIKSNQSVEPVEDLILEEVIKNKYYSQAETLLTEVLNENMIVLPESEEGYFKMHLVTLLSKEYDD